jgi:purine-binding chemotaxis protein CheW
VSDRRFPLATEASFRDAHAEREAEHGFDREVVTFGLAGERYGIDIGRLREIVAMRPVTPVPRVPALVAGVTSVRGAMVPVLQLRRCLGLPLAAAGVRTRILVIDHGGEPVGLIVDEVHKVLRLRAAMLEPPGAGITSALIEAIARPGDQLVLIIAVDAVVRSLEERM